MEQIIAPIIRQSEDPPFDIELANTYKSNSLPIQILPASYCKTILAYMIINNLGLKQGFSNKSLNTKSPENWSVFSQFTGIHDPESVVPFSSKLRAVQTDPNEVYLPCGPSVEPECGKPMAPSNRMCNAGWYCKPGYIRHSNGTCIPVSSCPKSINTNL